MFILFAIFTLSLCEQQYPNTQITLDVSKLPGGSSNVIINNATQNMNCTSIGTDWYSGQAIEVVVRSRQIDYGVYYESPVMKSMKSYLPNNQKAIQKLSETNFASHDLYTLYVMSVGDFSHYFTFDFLPNRCYLMSTNENYVLLFACYPYDEPEKISLISYYFDQNQLHKQSELLITIKPKRIVATLRYLFIAGDEEIQIFHFDLDGKNLQAIQNIPIEVSLFNVKQQIYDPDAKLFLNQYNLVIIDKNNKLSIKGIKLTNAQYDELFTETIDLKQEIKNQKFQIQDNTNFRGIGIISETQGINTLESYYIFTTNNVNQFGFLFTYDCQNNECKTLKSKEIKFQLPQYGDTTPNVNLISTTDLGFVALAYDKPKINETDYNDHGIHSFLIFNIKNLPNPQTVLQTIGGGSQYNEIEGLLIMKSDDSTYAFSSSQDFGSIYTITDKSYYCMNGEIKNQKLGFMAANNYEQQTIWKEINIETERDPNYTQLFVLIGVAVVLTGATIWLFVGQRNKIQKVD